jgi:hypothetical protein
MSVPEAEFQMGGGTPEQLPQGAAQNLNEGLEQVPQQEAPEAVAAPEEEPELAGPADYEPLFEPATEDEDFLVGPTTRPDEDVTAGTTAPQRVPAHVRSQLSALQAAADAPGASAELQALVSYLLRTS